MLMLVMLFVVVLVAVVDVADDVAAAVREWL